MFYCKMAAIILFLNYMLWYMHFISLKRNGNSCLKNINAFLKKIQDQSAANLYRHTVVKYVYTWIYLNQWNSLGSIPVLPLNFSSISFESPFDRDTVESCCKEIIHSVAHALASKRNIELCFSGIGRLTIRDSRVKMKFYKDFINEMDSSGKLVDSMMNVSFFLARK